MYICPTCNKGFKEEDFFVKHMLKCWREKNSHLKSKPAPRSEDINTRTVNNEIADFFNSFKKE
jgi:hypothetical protein